MERARDPKAAGDRRDRSADHHHGAIIRDYRMRRGVTQTQLAQRWPHGAVNAQYVQRVESGKKHIADSETLRGLSELLETPTLAIRTLGV